LLILLAVFSLCSRHLAAELVIDTNTVCKSIFVCSFYPADGSPVVAGNNNNNNVMAGMAFIHVRLYLSNGWD